MPRNYFSKNKKKPAPFKDLTNKRLRIVVSYSVIKH